MLLSTAACHRLTENEHVPGPVLLFPQNEAGKYLQLDLENINSKKKKKKVLFSAFDLLNSLSCKG